VVVNPNMRKEPTMVIDLGMQEHSTHKLAELRAAKSFSQKELAELLGTQQTTVANWEARGNIPARWLPRLAAILHTTVDEILDVPQAEPPQDIDRRTLIGQIYARAEKASHDQQRAIMQALDLIGIPKA
jgi:transcriptional regulator with XRE-family HTH domain